MDPFKERLIDHCRATLRRKIELVSFTMTELKASMESETKSSAGDKHETARARMQSELEKLGWQLDELKSQREKLYEIDPARGTETISVQNLVYTNHGIFLILVPLGKIEFEEENIYVISSNSPLAKKLIGLKVGGQLEMNGIKYAIEKIL